MFNVGTGELFLILLIALIVLGPDKLPEFAKKVGQVTRELRRMSHGFQQEMRQAIDFTDDDAMDRAERGPRLVPPPIEASVPDRGLDDGEGPSTPSPSGDHGHDDGPSTDTSAA